MYISIESQHTRSIRSAYNGEFLIVCGEGHSQGEDEYHDTRKRYEILHDYAKKNWPVEEFISNWSAHDFIPADNIPYVGFLHPATSTMFTATGFSKWGFAQSAASAEVFCDLIKGVKPSYFQTISATRFDPTSIPKTVGVQVHVAKNFIGDRVKELAGKITGKIKDVSELQNEEGAIVNSKSGIVAAYKDIQGQIHAVSPTCTHLGCRIAWNSAERSWDCPCHGSRFSFNGEVLAGPACKALERKELSW
jgi:Rieske Fe-S protein